MIRIDGVSKVYRVGDVTFYGLKRIDMTIYRGDFIAIMGPSGSGKTTLLNIIGLLDRPSSGRVFIDGIDVSALNDRQLARIRNIKLGFVFQYFNLINRLTVLENIEMPLVARGIPKNKRIELAKEALIRVGGELSWLLKKPLQLSGGQQQKVAIARAIVGSPEIVLADEPTGNLDRASAKTVINTFTELNKYGHTIIVVTHDPEVANCTRKIFMIRDGVVVDIRIPEVDKCILKM
ncbi:MAG: ABC transporter ATP-binding protein [Ignisphaera sp.]|nr:ABC transporter ATP-binding protein [Ignisphaera sp.]MCX8167515.1 ABC transporter ATP-binding protein [Ignisphaera sp.]